MKKLYNTLMRRLALYQATHFEARVASLPGDLLKAEENELRLMNQRIAKARRRYASQIAELNRRAEILAVDLSHEAAMLRREAQFLEAA